MPLAMLRLIDLKFALGRTLLNYRYSSAEFTCDAIFRQLNFETDMSVVHL